MATLAIPFQFANDGEDGSMSYALLIALDPEGLERVAAYDPAELMLKDLPPGYRTMRLREIHITSVSREELQTIKLGRMTQTQILKMLTRGYKYRPEAGDGAPNETHTIDSR